MSGRRAHLVLSDGTVFAGRGFGAETVAVGEVVFNTCLTGYQEVITDPSYQGQMVCMTTPHIGNTGINEEDVESARPRLTALIVREVSRHVSNWRATRSLPDWLAEAGVPGISDIDTRMLTRHIREQGVVHAALCTDGSLNPDQALAAARAFEGLEGRDLVREVTCAAPYAWTETTDSPWEPVASGDVPEPVAMERQPLVVAWDLGIKYNILRRLASQGFRVEVVPAATSAAEVLAMNPDGLFLSNGPGDPGALHYVTETARQLIASNVPLFGICLGHQIIAQALGAETFKLKFGHHGGNQPVSDLAAGNVQITSQNHNYSVLHDGLPDNVEITHWNLNDKTVEGLRLKDRPVFSVQYHPEASPGPHDADRLFAEFVQLVRSRQTDAG